MKRILLILTLLLCYTSFNSFAQGNFSGDDFLILRNVDTKKKQRFLINNMRVKCTLKSGVKLKGDLLVFSDHLFIDDQRIEVDQIKEIKWARNAFLMAGVALSAGAAGRVVRGQTENVFNTLTIGSAVVGIGLSALRNKKYNISKGWSFTISGMNQLNSFGER